MTLTFTIYTIQLSISLQFFSLFFKGYERVDCCFYPLCLFVCLFKKANHDKLSTGKEKHTFFKNKKERKNPIIIIQVIQITIYIFLKKMYTTFDGVLFS